MTSEEALANMIGDGSRAIEEPLVPAIYSQDVLSFAPSIMSPYYPSHQENAHFIFDSPTIATMNMNIPQAVSEHNVAKEMLNLCPPKVRSRLTSTPNASGACCTPNVMGLLDDDLHDLSPTGVNPLSNLSKVKSCLHKRPTVYDPVGVLFPGQNAHTGLVACDDSNQGLMKLDPNKEMDAPTSYCRGQLPRNLGASFQDSGFDSLGASTFSQESFSFINSPVKRKAGGITAVESPMKRLAFSTLQTQATDAGVDLESRIASYDMGLPGCSFFSDKDERMEVLETPPTPIFANAIQLSSPSRRKPISMNENFAFVRRTVLPPRQQNIRSPNETIHLVSVSDNSHHIGKTHLDIISHLAKRDLSHVITKIFSSMRPKDVFRSSHVSSSWAAICQNNEFLRSKIKSLKKQYRDDELKYGSENVRVSDAIKDALLKSPAKERSERDLSTGRSTLGKLQRRAKRTPTKVATIMLPSTPSGKNHFVPAENKYQHNQAVKRTLVFGETLRPCPKCGWTAKIYGDGSHKGLCYRYKCRFTFCTICKSSYHFPDLCSPPKLSPPSKGDTFKEPKIGTKKSRERLKKRLLM